MKTMALLLLGIALTAGCDGNQTGESRDLDRLRRATESYKDPEIATIAGWSTPITACMAAPDSSGAMGAHYGNTALIGDGGALDVERPEVLLYEPGPNHTRTLVAVEYVVPYAAHSRDSTPPTLFGQEFHNFDAFQLWGLHVWAWRDNSDGLYADWNPAVNCKWDPAATAMTMP